MKIYKVAVTEIYRKVVSVEAQNEQEAHQRAWDAWNNTEIILGMNDFEAAEMHVMDDGQENGRGKYPEDAYIEGYDYGFRKGRGTAKNGR